MLGDKTPKHCLALFLSQYVCTDSDGDSIPDLVELYGLLPNGELIETSPYETDSDFDGIPDNEEFNYVHSFLTPDVTLAEYINAIKANSFPGKDDSDGDGLNDKYDPVQKNICNNGKAITLESGEGGTLSQLQKWLVALGYLDMTTNPYGGIYGPVTKTAVYLYQMNHGFQTTFSRNGKELAIETIDDLTYATIANDYANKFGNGESDYYNYVSGISDKPYFDSIEISYPQLTELQKSEGVKITKMSNSIIKDESASLFELYFYDYTEPFNKMLVGNVAYMFQISILEGDMTTDPSIGYFLMKEFVRKVQPDGDWDYKIKQSWEKEVDNIPYMTISFPFIFRDDFCSAEKFGNVNYGYVGNAIGISEELLLKGGHVVSLIKSHSFESESDLDNIRKGFTYYDIDIQ